MPYPNTTWRIFNALISYRYWNIVKNTVKRIILKSKLEMCKLPIYV